MTLQVGVLEHDLLRLEPLDVLHITGMIEAASPGGDPAGLAQVPTPDSAAAYVEQQRAKAAAGDYVPFAQVLPDGRVVGHTSYLTPRYWPGSDRLLAIEIGTTWLHPAVQGTAVNSVAKLLLLTHAFESWDVARVDIKTDARNERARAGILAVGARLEGILRNWQPSQADGEQDRPRDTAMHAITADEWPPTRRALLARIEAKRGG